MRRLMIGNLLDRVGINEQGRLTRGAILLLDVANLVDPLVHRRNLRFDSVAEQAQISWNWRYRILN